VSIPAKRSRLHAAQLVRKPAKGQFEWIINPNGTVNHRLFVQQQLNRLRGAAFGAALGAAFGLASKYYRDDLWDSLLGR
jgi:hypothetical protein